MNNKESVDEANGSECFQKPLYWLTDCVKTGHLLRTTTSAPCADFFAPQWEILGLITGWGRAFLSFCGVCMFVWVPSNQSKDMQIR